MRTLIKFFTLSLSLTLLTACVDDSTVKEKIREATKIISAINDMKGDKKSGDGNSDGEKPTDTLKQTEAQRKADDKDNPWFARDFRMELTYELMGAVTNAVIQKSGNAVYLHGWNKSGSAERLFIIDDNDIKAYLISTSKKKAQFQKSFTDDYYTVFRREIGEKCGIIYQPENENKRSGDKFVETETKIPEITDEKWNGFDCEKITRTTIVKNNLGTGLEVLGAVLGNKKLSESAKETGMEEMTKTDIIWLHKESGALLHREYSADSDNKSINSFTQQMVILPSVNLLTFSPNAADIPTSLDEYELIK